MKLFDVNLLLYAIDETSPRFEPARSWLEETLNGNETIAFSWQVLLAFLRLSTKAQVAATPLSVGQAVDLIEGWLAQPQVVVVHPTERHLAVIHDLLTPLGTGGNLTADAHLAALAIEHGATLYSSDGDFRRFAGLQWRDPLD
jgi:toxin-antitoxin system PIN domain toxin